MGNIAVINVSGLSQFALQPIFDGPAALDRAITWAKTIPDYRGLVLLSNPQMNFKEPQDTLSVIRQADWTRVKLIDALAQSGTLAMEHDCHALFYVWGDCPLIDSKLTGTLWELHGKYCAQYTFADGYPYGLMPEILSANLPEQLKPLAKDDHKPVERNSIFEVLRKNINAFDVETHLAPADLRMQRVSISCDTLRNKNIAELLYSAGGTDADSLCRVIPENPALLRNLPAYYSIQISDHCPQSCSYCPFPKYSGNPLEGKNFMDKDRFLAICQKIVAFSDDAVISPSLWGEPASHPDIATMIQAALDVSENGRTKVLVETSGIGWNRQQIEKLAKDNPGGRIMWIVSLDAADPELYRQLRGDGMEEAESTAKFLCETFGDHCWIQAVRMNENEDDLDSFHEKWKDFGSGPIIQKYDSHAGYLPNLQPSDLSPINRFPCWHLKRDMSILIDGSVPVCKVDLGRSDILGNIFEDDLMRIWNAGEQIHESHIAKRYPGPCANCDEYYTFNF